MAIKYIKKADKTPSSDEVETRKRVQEILQQIENTREEGIKEISRKFDNYEGEIILSQDKIDDIINIPYASSFPTEIFTLSAWFKLNQPGGRAAIISRGEDNDSYNLSWQLYVSSSGELKMTK